MRGLDLDTGTGHGRTRGMNNIFMVYGTQKAQAGERQAVEALD